VTVDDEGDCRYWPAKLYSPIDRSVTH